MKHLTSEMKQQQLEWRRSQVLELASQGYSAYPFTLQARDQTEFTTADFDTVWNTLIANPDRPFP
jgi:hypothetical protein